jgi:hypothetical protein
MLYAVIVDLSSLVNLEFRNNVRSPIKKTKIIYYKLIQSRQKKHL